MGRKKSDDEPQEKQGRGRPKHVVTEQNRRMVMLTKAMRLNVEDIAIIMGVSTETLNKYYEHELLVGKTMCDLKASDALMRGIAKGDPALIKYYMNNQLKWSDRAAVDVTSGDKPLEPARIVFTLDMGDKKIDARADTSADGDAEKS